MRNSMNSIDSPAPRDSARRMRRLVRQCRILAIIFVALGALTGVDAVFYGRHTGRPVGGLLLSALSAALDLATAVAVTLSIGRWRP